MCEVLHVLVAFEPDVELIVVRLSILDELVTLCELVTLLELLLVTELVAPVPADTAAGSATASATTFVSPPHAQSAATAIAAT